MKSVPSPFPATIVFDLDGTLVDSAPDVTRAVNYALKRSGRRTVTQSQVQGFLGRGAHVLIGEALEAIGQPARDSEEISQLLPAFLDFYSANVLVETRPFPGAVEVLKLLRHGGARLAICTNKMEVLSRRLINALGLDEHFHANLGGDSLDVRKPDPRHLLATIGAAGGNAASAVMIGDSQADASAAKAAGVPIILVGFGYSHVPLESLEADSIISHYSQLPGVLADLHRARA